MNRHRRFAFRLAAGTLATAVLVSGCTAGSSGKDPVTLSVQPGTGVSTLIEIAAQQGFFTDAGLDVELTTVEAGPGAATALASGSVDVATNAPEVFTPMVDKGTDLQLVAGQTRTVGMLAATKNVIGSEKFPASVRALKGKKVAVTALSSTTQRLVEMLLKAAGMAPDSVDFVAAGASVDKALLAGRVDAALVTGPQIQRVLRPGTVPVVDLRTPQSCPAGVSPCGIAQVGMWAKASWVKGHGEQVTKIQGAIARADAWVHDPANRAAAVGFIGRQLGDGAPAAEREEYASSQLDVLTSVFPRNDLATWLRFDADNGITKQHLDVAKLLADGVAQNAGDVRAQVSAGKK
ncbi:ABC transporter substrate-binding protein [Amycolatopsis jejuensis]|uniref:ABC transporter substrate-binding protein n=1 Tax=Amycolatopsis jejuensis TaxID=330084 RepID=UPI00052427B8|nr:ABC transporter substrate-binding protein [Amycolatopsis jejuensis]